MSRLPKKKKEKIRLSLKDRVLYFLANLLLMVLGMGSYVFILLIEDRVLLKRPGVLAFSESGSLFLVIPVIIIAGIGIMVVIESESKGRSFRQMLSHTVSTRLKKALLILSVVLVVCSLLLAATGSSTVLKDDGTVEKRSFGILNKSYPGESVEKATFQVFWNSTNVPGGRFSRMIGFVCYVHLKLDTGKTVSFQYFNPENLSAIADLFGDRAVFEGQGYVEGWLRDLACDDSVKEEIRGLFFQEE